MTKRLISMLVLICVLAGALSQAAFAAKGDIVYAEDSGSIDHVDVPTDELAIDPETITADDLTVSETCIEFIMAYEGCINQPKWDVSQYSIGYGCSSKYAEKYGFSTSYISNEEAYRLLLCVLTEFEQKLNSFILRHDLSLKQHQYDSLISFSFNIGTGWLTPNSSNTYNTRIANLIVDGDYTINEFACAMGVFCHVGTGEDAVILNELLNRRIDEVKMFLFNIYEMPKQTNPAYTFCPVFFDGTEGSAQTDIGLYLCGEPFGELISGTHEDGLSLLGWYTEDGKRITPTTIVPDDDRLDVYAMWGDEEDAPEDELPPDNYPPEDTSSDNVTVVLPDDMPDDDVNDEPVETPWVDVTEVFTDVTEKSWFLTEVDDLYNSGVIEGYGDGTFRPNDKVTTGEALKMILLASGYEEPERAESHWARCYLDLAIEEGILDRWEITDLDVSISRQMVAKIAAKALDLSRYGDGNPFKDTSNEYVLALYDNSIIKGYENGTFRPNNKLTRAELAVIVWRIQQFY